MCGLSSAYLTGVVSLLSLLVSSTPASPWTCQALPGLLMFINVTPSVRNKLLPRSLQPPLSSDSYLSLRFLDFLLGLPSLITPAGVCTPSFVLLYLPVFPMITLITHTHTHTHTPDKLTESVTRL